ncbi:MAG: hypothetical protein VW835_19935, partial [Rickettsiales bacterium]
ALPWHYSCGTRRELADTNNEGRNTMKPCSTRQRDYFAAQQLRFFAAAIAVPAISRRCMEF